MFSNNLYQPQVVAALSQFTNLLSTATARTGTNASTSKYRISSHQTRKEKKETTSISTSDRLNEVKKTNEKLTIGVNDLVALPSQINVEELSPFLSLIRQNVVPSHVSAETFFENKAGFPESSLSSHDLQAEVQRILKTEPFRKFLTSYTSNLFHQQRRGFKTKRATVQPSKTDSGLFNFKYDFNKSFSEPQSSDKLNELLKECKDKDRQTQIQVAFAEGYAAKGDNPTQRKTLKKRLLNYAILIATAYILLVVLRVSSVFNGSGMGGMGILRQQQFEINAEEVQVTFDDVKGVDTAKDELYDVVDFLKDPDKYTALGAKLPKGVLLVGPPGVGKTLMARAVAGEAGVPFFQCSGSEFDEMYVGLGAKRVREMFRQAKMKGPCVIFIDEIDSVAAKRTNSTIHPYANQTVNQLLAEMDGFTQNDGLIVVGATNRVDNLDKALRRPGRFDVEVQVFLPDLKGRTEILNLYMKKIKADESIDAKALAKGTIGFSGADLHNLVNQAALKAAIEGKDFVSMKHMYFARDKVILGPENKNKIPDEQTNWNTAYHEAGHTLVAYFTKEATPLHKVTISPRGMSLGHTSFIPDKEQYGETKVALLATLDVAMGGRVAEEVIYGLDNVTTGAMSDFQQATRIATNMVKKYGMSEKIGVRFFEEGSVDTGVSFMITSDMSPAVQEQIDSEIKRLLQESYERAKQILKSHSHEHKQLAKALMDFETLDKDEIKTVIEGRKLNKQTN